MASKADRYTSAFNLACELQFAQGVEVAGDGPFSFGRIHEGDRRREQVYVTRRSRLVWVESHGNFLATLRRRGVRFTPHDLAHQV